MRTSAATARTSERDRGRGGRRRGRGDRAPARGELGARAFTDIRRLLAETDVDAVDICLPHHLHADAIVVAAAAGKHVLCEKPLCLTADEAERVQAAVAAAGVTLMCAHNQLFFPGVAKAKALLEAGAIGKVYEVRTTDSFFNDFDPTTMGWRASAATSGGGELIDTGYHPTYLMLHLAGGSPVEVTAMLSTHRLKFMEGEDSAQVLVRFDNGVVGHLVTSWAYEPAADHRAVLGRRRAGLAARGRAPRSTGQPALGRVGDVQLRSGRPVRGGDRPLRRLPAARAAPAAHGAGGHRGARDDPGRLRRRSPRERRAGHPGLIA